MTLDVNAPLEVPLTPPPHWFDAPTTETFDPRDGLIQVVTSGPDAGRVVALVAPEGEHILRDDIAWQPPQSPTNYEFAHVGTTICADGSKIRTANIGGAINHAGMYSSMREAVDLYANTASRTMRVRYHDVPGIGVVAAGAVYPGHTVGDAITVMGMAISGDWRMVQSLGERDLAGSQLVNVPALRPLPHGVKRRAGYRPQLFRPIAASLGDPATPVYGGWGEEMTVGDRLSELLAEAARIIAHQGPDEDFPDIDDIDDIAFPWVTPASPAPPVAIDGDVDDIAFPHHDDDDDDVAFPWSGDDDDGEFDPDDAELGGVFTDHFGCPKCRQGGHDDCRRCGGTKLRTEVPHDMHGYVVATLDDLD